jgi:hypothetical protein
MHRGPAAHPARRLKTWLAAGALALAAGAAHAQSWESGDGWASVTNEAGAWVMFTCASFTDGQGAAMQVSAPSNVPGLVAGSNVTISFAVDGAVQPQGARTIAVNTEWGLALQWGALSDDQLQTLATFAEVLRSGGTLRIVAPPAGLDQTFPLAGAAEALDGVVYSCVP